MSNRHLQGIGFAEMCDQVATELERVHEESKWRNDGGEHVADLTRVQVYVWAERGPAGVQWIARPVSEQPFVGMFAARGRDRQHALNELRTVHAWQLHAKTGIEWDAARKHATRYVYEPA